MQPLKPPLMTSPSSVRLLHMTPSPSPGVFLSFVIMFRCFAIYIHTCIYLYLYIYIYCTHIYIYILVYSMYTYHSHSFLPLSRLVPHRTAIVPFNRRWDPGRVSPGWCEAMECWIPWKAMANWIDMNGICQYCESFMVLVTVSKIWLYMVKPWLI